MIKRHMLLVVVLLFMNACATWDREERISEGVYLGLQVVDYLQSRSMVRNTNDYTETNIVLGENPSMQRLTNYNAIAFIAHPIVSHLFKSHRKKWIYITLGVELNAVIENHQIGLKVKF